MTFPSFTPSPKLTEKILGINQSDWNKVRGASFECNCSDCKLIRSKLVPVVSVELLEKSCKENANYFMNLRGKLSPATARMVCVDAEKHFNDLLLAVKKRGEQTRGRKE